jgi:hypothetical protein
MMDIVKETFFTKSIVYKNSIVLYNPQNAVDVVKFCQTMNKRIYGLDAFRFVGNGIQPVLEFSTDYSCDKSAKVYEEAIEHVQKLFDENLYFEVIYTGYGDME